MRYKVRIFFIFAAFDVAYSSKLERAASDACG
jgi:hypothetical protein